ncbi:TolC family protein [Fimbriimonadia bacterium ATM]|nr:MAG: TolC family protein [Armatimonadota bacterium]MBC6969367.1 TolC family protein [Armatimonadota bacterium]MCE7899295.1 TolC family protein [Armatimonadetes bacterium ATM1]MDL1927868.1 TolC family protein [Fimbriimonadia bacterium ATM]RIJ97352.1 MAG: hypothetical protein DCC45_04780 [Armatimonadota bacterium]
MKSILTILCLSPLAATAQAQQPITLEQALRSARENRPAIVAAQMRVSSARLSRRGLGAYPTTKLFVGHTDREEVGGIDDDLVLVQPIDIFGRAAAARAVGSAEILRAESELAQVLAEIQYEVIAGYSEAASAKALADNAGQLMELAQRLHDAVKVLVAEGKLPGVQLSRVAIELERAKLTFQRRTAEFQSSVRRLAGILGLSPEQIAISDFATLNVGMVDPAVLKTRRADLRLLAADIQLAQAESRVANLGSKPELEVHGRQTSWHDSHRQYGIRVQLAIPLYDFGKSRSETAAARMRAEAAERALADATRIAESELLAAQIELESAQEQVARYGQVVTDARSLVDKSRQGFVDRAVTLIELLEATRALRELEEGYVEARLHLASAQAAYLKASGTILEVGK